MINRIHPANPEIMSNLPMKIVTRLSSALLLILYLSVFANGRVETVRFQSKLINATLPYNVILPIDYDTSTTTRYPVLMLGITVNAAG